MDVPVETGYQAPPGYVEDKKDSLIDLDLDDDSTELWLIQWPINQTIDFDGQTVSLKLSEDGHMGTFEATSGKSYDVFSSKSQGPEATVFLSSSSEAKIAGKISRRVSLINYPKPGEVQKRHHHSGHSQRSSGATSTLSGRRMPTPTRSIKPKSSGYSTQSDRSKSSLSGDSSRPPKRKRVEGNSSPTKGNSAGSVGNSEERKSKKKKET